MVIFMYERVEDNIKFITKNRELKNLAKSAISEIKLTKKSKYQYLISFCIALILSYIITYKSDTVTLMFKAVEIINTTSLALIAIIFGTYAIFQALMSDSVIWALLNSENNLLNVSNKSFLHLILLYWFEILVNIILLIFLQAIPSELYFFESLKISNLFAFLLESIYFGYCFLLIYEIKNFTVNLYQMFNVYNIYRGLDILEGKIEKDIDTENL